MPDVAEKTTETTVEPEATFGPSDAAPQAGGPEGDKKAPGIPEGYIPKSEYDKVLAERDQHRREAENYRSAEIQKIREFNRGGSVEDLREDLEELKGALREGFSAGNLEGYFEKSVRARTEREAQAFQGQLKETSEKTSESILAIGQELGVDPNTHEAFTLSREYFTAAQRAAKTGKQDAVFLAGVLLGRAEAEARLAAIKVLKGRHSEELKKAREEGERTTRRQAERESAADMSTGPAAGGGGADSLESLSKVDTRGWSQKDLLALDKRLDAAMKRGR